MLDQQNQPKLNHVKSYSWDSSAKSINLYSSNTENIVNGLESEKRSLPQLIQQRESNDQNFTEPEVQVSYVMHITNETPENRAERDDAEKINYMLTPSQFSTVGNDQERKEWVHSDQVNLLQPKSNTLYRIIRTKSIRCKY